MKKKKILSYRAVADFCLGLARLVHAGLTTGDALELLSRDETDPVFGPALAHMARDADAGVPLSQTVAGSGLFPGHVRVMLGAGEETGRLEEALFSLASYYEERAALDDRLRSALTRPLVLFAVLAVVLIALVGWVLPVFEDVYRQLGTSLTGLAGGLLAVGRALRWALPVLIPLAVLVCAALLWLACSEKGRRRVGKYLRRTGTFAMVDSVRLAQVLALALNSGLSGEQALELAIDPDEGDSPFRMKCRDCLDRLRGSENLPNALEHSGLFAAADCRMLEAGIRSGCADTVMADLARRMAERTQARLDARLDRIEPALVLVASLLVGFILLSVLLPLARIMSAIG